MHRICTIPSAAPMVCLSSSGLCWRIWKVFCFLSPGQPPTKVPKAMSHECLNHSFSRLPQFFPTKQGTLFELNKHALARQCMGKIFQAYFPGPCDSPVWYGYGAGVITGVPQEVLGSEFEGIYEEVSGSSLRARGH